MKKNIILFLITTFTIVACQKESEVLPTNDGASYWVENGILNVKNQAVLDSLIAVNSEKSEEEMVAWSDSVGFKSLAAVYKDAEKEKDVLSFDELKAKYEGKLVFNSAEPKEKQFMCAITNLEMSGFVNENAQIIVNGEINNLKGTNTAKFELEITNLKFGRKGVTHLQSIDGKRCMQVWIDGSKYTTISKYGVGLWDLVVDVYTEKKVWGGWIGYDAGVYIKNIVTGVRQNWEWKNTGDSMHLGHNRYFAYSVPSNLSFRIWTSGVLETKGISLFVSSDNDIFLTY